MPLFPELEPRLPDAPLAERRRPRSFDEYVGQQELVGEGEILRRLVEAANLPSMILWGPPGTGKTTLARLLAGTVGYAFEQISGAIAGKKDIARVVEIARRRQPDGTRTLLFVDELHRFNKLQQDALLPHVESGLVTLVGATTENPSFEVISPLLSRCRVFVLQLLSEEALGQILEGALADGSRGYGGRVALEPGLDAVLVELAAGDGRKLLTLLEMLASSVPEDEEGQRLLTRGQLASALQRDALAHDKSGDAHYDTISALHKSVRSGDPDAALYWLARMLQAGEDPLYLGRRLVRMAVEDIGTADPHALTLAISAVRAYEFLGSPEGELALAQLTVCLALSPKSNAVYRAYGAAGQDVEKHGALPVPLVLRNAPTRLMSELGFGQGYKYAHDYEEGVVDQQHLPDKLAGQRYFEPGEQGFDRQLQQRLARWRERLGVGDRRRED